MTKQDDDDALVAIERAQRKVRAMCQGSEKWSMSIPARLDYDPDILIMDALVKAHNSISGRRLSEQKGEVRVPISDFDREAVAWALGKLKAFGVVNSTMDGALMADRLETMLAAAEGGK